MGELLHRLVRTFGLASIEEFDLIQRLFTEQFKVSAQEVVLKKKTEISGKTLQSAHDLGVKYIKKGSGQSQQIDIGFGANLTETIDALPLVPVLPPSPPLCPPLQPLNLITDVAVFGVDKGEKECFLPGITNTEKVTNNEVSEVSSEGNYHCPKNVEAIQQLNEQENRQAPLSGMLQLCKEQPPYSNLNGWKMVN